MPSPQSPATYRNPLLAGNCPDPFMLRDGSSWLMFSTGPAADGRFIPIHRSDDLVHWQFVRGAVEPGPRADSWNRRNFWAPEVLQHGGRFWLYYTAMPDGTPRNTGNRVGVAVADRAEGPYEDRGPVLDYPSLDGSPFRDADGSLYLYHTAEFGSVDDQPGRPWGICPPALDAPLSPGRIYVDRLTAPDKAAGRPRELIGLHPWQEGPVALARGGRYFLFYSTGNWGDASYAVRWSVGQSPLGPFIEQPGALLASSEQAIGPGHHNFFTGPDGGDWIIYHAWDPGHTARMPRMDRLTWRAGRPATNGPTTTPQRL